VLQRSRHELPVFWNSRVQRHDSSPMVGGLLTGDDVRIEQKAQNWARRGRRRDDLTVSNINPCLGGLSSLDAVQQDLERLDGFFRPPDRERYFPLMSI
jgi:hypothetical protein